MEIDNQGLTEEGVRYCTCLRCDRSEIHSCHNHSQVEPRKYSVECMDSNLIYEFHCKYDDYCIFQNFIDRYVLLSNPRIKDYRKFKCWHDLLVLDMFTKKTFLLKLDDCGFPFPMNSIPCLYVLLNSCKALALVQIGGKNNSWRLCLLSIDLKTATYRVSDSFELYKPSGPVVMYRLRTGSHKNPNFNIKKDGYSFSTSFLNQLRFFNVSSDDKLISSEEFSFPEDPYFKHAVLIDRKLYHPVIERDPEIKTDFTKMWVYDLDRVEEGRRYIELECPYEELKQKKDGVQSFCSRWAKQYLYLLNRIDIHTVCIFQCDVKAQCWLKLDFIQPAYLRSAWYSWELQINGDSGRGIFLFAFKYNDGEKIFLKYNRIITGRPDKLFELTWYKSQKLHGQLLENRPFSQMLNEFET